MSGAMASHPAEGRCRPWTSPDPAFPQGGERSVEMDSGLLARPGDIQGGPAGPPALTSARDAGFRRYNAGSRPGDPPHPFTFPVRFGQAAAQKRLAAFVRFGQGSPLLRSRPWPGLPWADSRKTSLHPRSASWCFAALPQLMPGPNSAGLKFSQQARSSRSLALLGRFRLPPHRFARFSRNDFSFYRAARRAAPRGREDFSLGLDPSD